MKKLILILASLFSTCSKAADTDQELLAATLVLEAAGEGNGGMQAVACVVVNRSIRSGLSVREVILAPHQFATSKFGAPVKTASQICTNEQWYTAMAIAKSAMGRNLLDITNGATHFHSEAINPYWSKSLTKTKKIGRHIFYRENVPQRNR